MTSSAKIAIRAVLLCVSATALSACVYDGRYHDRYGYGRDHYDRYHDHDRDGGRNHDYDRDRDNDHGY